MDDEDGNESVATAESIYDEFLATTDLMPTLTVFYKLCKQLDINPKNYKTIFTSLKAKLKTWKCQTLFNKLEKKSKHVDYKNKPCAKTKVLIIGAGPVGLRTAVEIALLGAHVIVIEKRDSFSRNNVLHLWPFLIVDLKAIGVKSFFGKFCAGSLDHISIRRLQCILLKICLLLGVQVFPKTLFTDLVEPNEGKGWFAKIKPPSSPLNAFEFDVIVACDGKNNSLKFKRKEFRGKLAIAITCNFVNKQTSEEARVEEISGVAFIYNQEFFHQLTERTGVELENIVYYKGETHYFVMTAKKKSLLNKGVIKQDSKDVFKLLSSSNISHQALLQYAKEAADFSTKYQLPHHEFALNHQGKEDVAMFDFTSIHQAESSSKILERKGKRLLMCIAGDVLLEPFWPTGSGCARGFLGAFDAAWMIRGFGLGRESLDLIQERESIFKDLPQTKPSSLIRFHDKYSINPATRYLNLNARRVQKDQIKHLLDASDGTVDLENWASKEPIKESSKPVKVKKKEVDPNTLLKWCKEQTAEYPNVEVINMSSSWRSGLAFCAIIHRYRPHLIDYFALDPNDVEGNCEMAFSVAEEHLGIPPKISGHDLATQKNADILAIMAYVSLYYEALSNETPVSKKSVKAAQLKDGKPADTLPPKTPTSKMSILTKLSRRSKKTKLRKKSKKDKEDKLLTTDDKNIVLKSFERAHLSNGSISHSDQSGLSSSDSSPTKTHFPASPIDVNNLVARTPERERKKNEENTELKNGINPSTGQDKFKRISQLAEAVFGDTIVQSTGQAREAQLRENLTESEKCHFCSRKVYVMERQSAEGLFFHRKCFRCCICKCQLLLGNYAFFDDDDTEGSFYCKMHYNRLIYKTEETTPAKKASDRRRRPLTQIIEKSDVSEAFRKKSTEEIELSPKFSRQVRDIQAKLKENLPEIEVKQQPNKKRHSSNLTVPESIDGKPDERLEDAGPYDKFAAKSLLDRHPSITKFSPQKVKTSSFFTASKFSVSTPNLTKLIQEDSMFEKERNAHVEKLSYPYSRKKLALSEELAQQDDILPEQIKVRKRLLVPDDLKSQNDNDDENSAWLRDTYGSELYRERNDSFEVTRQDSIGAVQRRPMEERRAQYPVSMAFSEGLRAAGFKPLSIAIDIDDVTEDIPPPAEEAKPKKKKKLVLKKKKKEKKVTKEDIIEEQDEEGQVCPKKVNNSKDRRKSFEKSLEKSTDKSPKLPKFSPLGKGKEKKKKQQQQQQQRDDDWVLVKAGEYPKSEEEMFSDSSSSEEEEPEEKQVGLLRRALGKKTKKRQLTDKELTLLEEKKKRKEKKKIEKELKERQTKRLWEAQSIQRKLNEVDVKQFELEERARQVEKDLQDETMPEERINSFMFEWFHLVNEKNTLLRFESELVIQSNSIQLEDRQARLEQQIRDLLTCERPKPNSHDEIDRLTKELVDTVEQRNALVELLEEDRLREMEEDKNLKEIFANKAHDLGMDRLI